MDCVRALQQAVDAHVSKSLFEDCICGALKGKTRVLVTHQARWLRCEAIKATK